MLVTCLYREFSIKNIYASQKKYPKHCWIIWYLPFIKQNWMHSTCIFLSDVPVPDKPVCDIVDQENTFFCTIWPSWLTNKRNKMNCELMLTYDTPTLRQTGSRNLTGQKTLPTIWGTYMKLLTKYQISAINSCWEKCAYMFNV
jgi:hypothetical protein